MVLVLLALAIEDMLTFCTTFSFAEAHALTSNTPLDAVNILIRSKATNYITSIALIQFDVIPPRTNTCLRYTSNIEHAMPCHAIPCDGLASENLHLRHLSTGQTC